VEEKIYDTSYRAYPAGEFTKVRATQPVERRRVVTPTPRPAQRYRGLGEGPAAGNNFIVDSRTWNLRRVADAQGNQSPRRQISINVGFDVDEPPYPRGEARYARTSRSIWEPRAACGHGDEFAEASSTKVFEQDGYGMGYLENFKIDQSGSSRRHSNVPTVRSANIALRALRTPTDWKRRRDELRPVQQLGTGEYRTFGYRGEGQDHRGTLEMSNVDLAEQFTDMMSPSADSRPIQNHTNQRSDAPRALTLKR
jgi:flagellar hook protein FlgE